MWLMDLETFVHFVPLGQMLSPDGCLLLVESLGAPAARQKKRACFQDSESRSRPPGSVL